MDISVLVAVAVRVTIVYAFLFVVVRLMGRRKLGIHSTLDLVVAILIANLASDAVFGGVSVLHAFFAIALVGGWHYAGYYFGVRNSRLQHWMRGEPLVVARDGEMLTQALVDERLAEAELWSLLRQQGVESLDEVKLAIIEPSGRLSVVRQEWAREAQKGDLQALAGQGGAL